LEVSYPAQLIEVVEVLEGEFFKQSDGVTSFTHAVNTGAGRIAIGVLRNDATGVTGKAPLLTLRLRARASGPVELRVTNLKPIALGSTVQVADLPVIILTVK
jgi:general secretion pathway protein D